MQPVGLFISSVYHKQWATAAYINSEYLTSCVAEY